MDFLDLKRDMVRCTNCNEQILRNREVVLNNKTICLGCAVEKGITQVMDLDVNHKLNCFKKADFMKIKNVIFQKCDFMDFGT